ncbi:ABC transporter permease [Cellulomonas triticagri]|uniref:ABC transporter permease n=1 Tax=Cellulomonas triticagri TaxID=2483352 RepID=A0A3M2J518_9CELL|nr:ABC transporter permease [Cellulomonas triticagri]RMI07010.1 ABC transporter permease [Cellulomonas triticagri]
MTGLVGALVEAWDELRVHRLRVLLSLIGVAAAVTAITGVTAAVDMLTQVSREQSERWTGRETTLTVSAYPMTGTPDVPAAAAAMDALVEKYQVTYATRVSWTQVAVELPGGAQVITAQSVDPHYGTIHRLSPGQGRWFAPSDAERLAPTLVVNEAFLAALGADDLSGHPTVVLQGDQPVTAEVIGVVANAWAGEGPAFTVLQDHVDRWGLMVDPWGSGAQVPALELWVPPGDAEALRDRATQDLAAALPGWQVDVQIPRGETDVLDSAARWVVIAVSGFALLLGGLGLLNIALVTVRQRIREIGIRRSFGATSGRVFFGVLLESVVATLVAGAVGVALAVVGLQQLPLDQLLGTPLQDTPPFPVAAALTGLACAAGVGALAGLLPAVWAVRVKVIDAIRY